MPFHEIALLNCIRSMFNIIYFIKFREDNLLYEDNLFVFRILKGLNYFPICPCVTMYFLSMLLACQQIVMTLWIELIVFFGTFIVENVVIFQDLFVLLSCV